MLPEPTRPTFLPMQLIHVQGDWKLFYLIIKLSGKHSLRTTLAMTFIDNEVKKGADGKPIIHGSEILVNSGQLGIILTGKIKAALKLLIQKIKSVLRLITNTASLVLCFGLCTLVKWYI